MDGTVVKMSNIESIKYSQNIKYSFKIYCIVKFSNAHKRKQETTRTLAGGLDGFDQLIGKP